MTIPDPLANDPAAQHNRNESIRKDINGEWDNSDVCWEAKWHRLGNQIEDAQKVVAEVQTWERTTENDNARYCFEIRLEAFIELQKRVRNSNVRVN